MSSKIKSFENLLDEIKKSSIRLKQGNCLLTNPLKSSSVGQAL